MLREVAGLLSTRKSIRLSLFLGASDRKFSKTPSKLESDASNIFRDIFSIICYCYSPTKNRCIFIFSGDHESYLQAIIIFICIIFFGQVEHHVFDHDQDHDNIILILNITVNPIMRESWVCVQVHPLYIFLLEMNSQNLQAGLPKDAPHKANLTRNLREPIIII